MQKVKIKYKEFILDPKGINLDWTKEYGKVKNSDTRRIEYINVYFRIEPEINCEETYIGIPVYTNSVKKAVAIYNNWYNENKDKAENYLFTL